MKVGGCWSAPTIFGSGFSSVDVMVFFGSKRKFWWLVEFLFILEFLHIGTGGHQVV
jgi:hypothetical protein